MLGPFDGRRKRSRCQRCAASHLKCSGKTPCSNCERKGKPCSYAVASADKPIIVLGSGGHTSTLTFAVAAKHSAGVVRQRTAALRPSPAMDDERYFYYFDVFAERNNFNGKRHLFTKDVKQMGELQTSPYLMNSIRALGAFQASKLLVPQQGKYAGDTYSGYVFYSQAVVGLRQSLDGHQKGFSQSNRTALLWTTLFLGMFELMSDASEVGWLQHMVHGTAKGLVASGPSICLTEAGARMFQQAKMFEVCRTIVFNDTSILTRPEWMSASQEQWKSSELSKDWRPLDSLVDIMLLCPDLRHRANRFCDAEEANPSPGVPQEARDIASEGWKLREALNTWHRIYMEQDGTDDSSDAPSPNAQPTEVEEDCNLLTRLFWSAISIYLSGEFDYEIHHWNRFELKVPILDKETVTEYVETILSLTEFALENSTLSPLLFLFPLRIAGARSAWASKAQRDRVLRIVDTIAGRFAVGRAIREGLQAAWVCMGVVDD